MALLRKRSKAAQDESHLRAESPLKRMRLDAGSKPVEGQASFQTGEDKGSPHDFQAGFQEVDNASEPAVKAQPGRKLFLLDLFCGTAGVAAAFQTLGGEALGLDHLIDKRRVKGPVAKVDLLTKEGQQTVEQWMTEGKVDCVMLAPPCGTLLQGLGRFLSQDG